MYDIKPLEDEWKKYRNKKLKPWYIASAVFFIIVVLVVVFMSNKNLNSNQLLAYIKTSFTPLAIVPNKEEEKIESTVQNNVLLGDALKALETRQKADTSKEVSEKPSDIFVDVPILEDGTNYVAEEAYAPKKKIHLDIVETTSPTAYQDVEKRFVQSRDIDDALFLANSYYNKGNYKKAEYWAMQANKLDGDTEESLLIFVKAKIKLGHKNEAISILASYIERSDSEEAKKLLFRIKNGKF
jgi:tetratricopeptide (TPR) repeat protein